MPLGAMVFAMQQAQISSAGYVVVSYDEMQTEFYNVKLTSKHITYCKWKKKGAALGRDTCRFFAPYC